MFGGDFRRHRAQQAPAPDDPLQSVEGIFQVQLPTQIGRQDKPPGHFLLLSRRGHLLGLGVQHLLPEAEFKKLLLVGLADDLDLVKLPAPEGLQNPLRMMLNEVEVRHWAAPFFWARPKGVARPFDRPRPAVGDAPWPARRAPADSGGTPRPSAGPGPAGLWGRSKSGPCPPRCESGPRRRGVGRRRSGSWVCRICGAASRRSLGPSVSRAEAGATSGPRRRKRARTSGAARTDSCSSASVIYITDTDSKQKNEENVKKPRLCSSRPEIAAPARDYEAFPHCLNCRFCRVMWRFLWALPG